MGIYVFDDQMCLFPIATGDIGQSPSRVQLKLGNLVSRQTGDGRRHLQVQFLSSWKINQSSISCETGRCDTGQTLSEVETGRELGISREGWLQQGQNHLQFSVQVHFEREKRGERLTDRSAPPSKHEMNHLFIDTTVSSFDKIEQFDRSSSFDEPTVVVVYCRRAMM
jgi:hypothetical protein